jgi:hypothetical protein
MTTKPETLFWRELRDSLKNVHFQRIENLSGQGVPDVNACTVGCEFWLELKVSEGRFPKLSNYQIAWHYKRSQHGGKTFILQKSPKQSRMNLFEGRSAINMRIPVPVASGSRSRSPSSRFPVPVCPVLVVPLPVKENSQKIIDFILKNYFGK